MDSSHSDQREMVPCCGFDLLLSKSLQTVNPGEGVEKREPFYTVGGNAN